MKKACILTFMSLFLISPQLFTQHVGFGLPIIIAGKENKVFATGFRLFYDSDWGNRSTTTHFSYFLPIKKTYDLELTPRSGNMNSTSVKTDLTVKTYGFAQSYTFFFLGEYSDEFSLGGNLGGGAMFGSRDYRVEDFNRNIYMEPDFGQSVNNWFFNLHVSIGLLFRKEVGNGSFAAMGGYTKAMIDKDETLSNTYFNDFSGPYFHLAYYIKFDGASRRRSW